MLHLSQYTPTTFLRAVNDAIADPSYVLSVPINHVITPEHEPHIKQFFADLDRNKPHLVEYIAQIIPMFAAPGILGLLGAGIGFNLKRYQHAKQLAPAKHIERFLLQRHLHTLRDDERALLRATAALVAQKLITPNEWARFLGIFAWAGGKNPLEPTPSLAGHRHLNEARSLANKLLGTLYPSYDAFFSAWASDLALHRAANPKLAAAVDDILSQGARWMTAADVDASPFYSTTRTHASLFLGYLNDTTTPVYFSGHESLITVAGPGSGKSTALAIPNLLTYEGSAIVLDVKGELWNATAHRRSSFGPIYRFAPTDPNGQSHRFNPFDLVSPDPAIAANDWQIFANQIIVERPSDRDPYWEGRARDFLWALGMLITFTAPRDKHTLEHLAELLSLPTSLQDPEDRNTCHPTTRKVIAALRQLSQQLHIPDLNQAANSIWDGLGSNRLESVLDAARRHMSAFARSALIRRALSTTDWHPSDLRKRPGTTVYICIDDPKTFGPVIRLTLYQHFRVLKNYAAKPTEPPITYFLDEMPRLGNFTDILEIQDTGRGAGLRLWMFAQSYGQLIENFGEARAPGIIDTSRVRLFLQPQADELKFITPYMGDVHNIFTGERRPLATDDELMGAKYGRNIIATARGERPLLLTPRFAHKSKTLSALIKPPPDIAYPK